MKNSDSWYSYFDFFNIEIWGSLKICGIFFVFYLMGISLCNVEVFNFLYD